MSRARILAVVLAAASCCGAAVAADRTPFAVDRPRLAPRNEPMAAFDVRGAATPRTRLLAHPAGIPLTTPAPGSAEDIALRFVRERLAPAGEIVPLDVVDGPRGLRFVSVEQRFGDLRVARGRIDLAILADGSVLSARVGELAGKAPPPRAPQDRRAIADGASARVAALAPFGLGAGAPAGPDQIAKLVPEPVILALDGGALRAWRVQLAPDGRAEHLCDVFVAEDSGRVLAVTPLVQAAIQGARVWPQDGAQASQWVAFPDPVARPSVHSPTGWDEAGQTNGNNAWVELDRESNFTQGAPQFTSASGDPLVLDFTVTGNPQVDTDAAVTNVFWAINDAHDRFRRLGFDEASGACQRDNFNRGGRANDPIYGMVQWDSIDGTNPANFLAMGIGADGNFNYLLTSLFLDEGGTLRDGALETDLLYHELTHSATIRLIGGDAACFNGAQPQAISEGLSDFMAVSWTNDPVVGAYTSGRPVQGQRDFPIGGGGWSYVNLCEGGCARYRDGEIVAGLLWDLRALLRQRLGAAPGTERAERLALEAVRFAPCRPTLPDLRDAMLVADSALFDGVDRCTIWQAFAGRGVGASTMTTGPDDQLPVGAYDLPPECSGGTSVTLDQREYSTDADARVEVVDARLPAGAVATVTSSGGDSVTIALAAAGGSLLRGVVPIRPGVVNTGDALLQVASGDTITARYASAPVSTARISSALPVVVVSHHVYGNWCQMQADDDSVDPWYVLSGFLDAGENGTIDLELAHDVGVALEDVRLQVTSLNPDVLVLPSTPIPLGTVPGREGSQSLRRFTAQFRANAAPTVTAGEIAPIRFDVLARGRQGTVTLDLELNMDYEIVSGVSAFDAGVETFDRGSSTASLWTSSASRGTLDLWAREDCAGNAGTSGIRNGNVGCSDYSDGQVAATIVSPPIFPLPADAVAYRLNAFDWDADVNLYTDPANGFCDADFVGMFLTTDPATLPYDTPEAVYSQAYGACQRYWRPIYESTGGYVRQRSFSFTTNSQMLDPALAYDQLRVAFIFWGDVYDCGFETANAGHFRLDNFAFSYDVARKIPESAPCAADCLVTTSLVMDPPGPLCPGTPVTLRVTTESTNCAGVMYHSFGGPGVGGSSGWTTDSEAPAIWQDGEYYAVYSECETSPQCADYRAFQVGSLASPGVGAPWPDSLRVRRDGADVELEWTGATVPPAYAVLRATTRAELAAGPATWAVAGVTNAEGPAGEAGTSLTGAALEAGVAYYQVFGRDRCTDVPRIP